MSTKTSQLQRLPQDSPEHRASHKLLNMTPKAHKAVHQAQVIKCITNFFYWEYQWRQLRLVSKSWRDAIETKSFTSGVIDIGSPNPMPAKLLSRFCNGSPDVSFRILPESFDPAPLYSMRNLKRLHIDIYPNILERDAPEDILRNWLKFSRTSLMHLQVDFPYILPFKFEQLETYVLELLSETSEITLSAIISQAKVSKVKLLTFLPRTEDIFDEPIDILDEDEYFVITKSDPYLPSQNYGGLVLYVNALGDVSSDRLVSLLEPFPSMKYVFIAMDDLNKEELKEELPEDLDNLDIEILLGDVADHMDYIYEKEGKTIVYIGE